MSKKNKKPTVTSNGAVSPRPSNEITQEYQQLCINLGNELIKFEVIKSQAIARYQQLNDEMLRAQAHEQAMQQELEKKGEQLINLTAEKAAREVVNETANR